MTHYASIWYQFNSTISKKTFLSKNWVSENSYWKHNIRTTELQIKIRRKQRKPFHHATLTTFLVFSKLFLYSFLAQLAIRHAYIKITTQLHIAFKKYHSAFLCNSLRKLKISQDQRLGPQNPGHRPRDPGYSSNTFCLDSLWSHTSHTLNRMLPGVTGLVGWLCFMAYQPL